MSKILEALFVGRANRCLNEFYSIPMMCFKTACLGVPFTSPRLKTVNLTSSKEYVQNQIGEPMASFVRDLAAILCNWGDCILNYESTHLEGVATKKNNFLWTRILFSLD